MPKYRITGDWMKDGFIDNLGRERALEIIVRDGHAYDAEWQDQALAANIEGQIVISGSCSFCPDAGELDRIGNPIFVAA